MKENHEENRNKSPNSRSSTMREEASTDFVGPWTQKEAQKLSVRKYAGPRQYRESVKESYRATLQNEDSE